MRFGDRAEDRVLPDQLTRGQSGKELVGLIIAMVVFATIVASFFVESGL